MSLSLLSLSLIPLPARAQSYGPPIYTSPGAGATFGSPSTTYPYGSYNGYGGGGPGPASCAGQMKATFTWSGGSGNAPPPQTVIVTQTGSASWQVYGDSGSCDDGLGDAAAPSTVAPFSPGNGTPWPFNSAVSQGTHYKTQSGGASVEVDCTPTASVPRGYGAADCAVAYSAAVSPVTIVPGGATSDGNGGWDILVGQKCAPSLNGIPAACTVSNYQWTVTGTTMQSWTVSPDQSYTTEVDGPGPLNILVPLWYWNDQSQTTETITCTATVTPPAGQGSAFSVTASQKVTVWVPDWSAKGFGGEMLVDQPTNPNISNQNGSDYWLDADPLPSSNLNAGMIWEATVYPPAGCPSQWESGYLEIVQLITPSVAYLNSSYIEYDLTDQGQVGLDTSWPYGWSQVELIGESPQGTPAELGYYYGGDSPGLDLTQEDAISGDVDDSFEDYLMYEPPGSSNYVPVATFSWSTNGSANIPRTNNWANFVNPAGPINPSGGWIPFSATHTYPSWMRNSGNGIGFVEVE